MGTLTADDYVRTPAGPPWYQLIGGALLQEPAPFRDHQDASHELGYALSTYLRKHPIGLIFFAPFDVYLDDTNVFQPDIFVVRKERASLVAQDGMHGAPDFVVEILSPSNRRLDLGPKKAVYARAGVRELWIVDPREQSVAGYDLALDASMPARRWNHAGDTILTSPLFPGLAVPLSAIFVRR